MASDAPLEYITVDSVRWSTSSQRPRMDPAERKARHRLQQKRHMERKQEQITKLIGVISMLELQLEWLQATREVAQLEKEQGDLRRRLGIPERETSPWKVLSDMAADALEDQLMNDLLEVVEHL